MEELNRLIYEKIIQSDENTDYTGEEYNALLAKSCEVTNQIIEIMTRSISKKEALQLINQLQEIENEMLYYYEYMDFKNYFFKGLAVGMETKELSDEQNDKLVKIFKDNL